MSEGEPVSLDVLAQSHQFFVYYGAALMALSGRGDPRCRETFEQLWQAIPFLKALTAVALVHENETRELWEQALKGPMPFGYGPIGMPGDETR